MIAGVARALLLCGTLTLAAGHALSAQPVEPREPVDRTILGGRVHVQYNTTSVDDDGEPSSEVRIRRARIWVATAVNDWIDAAVQVDVARETAAARYAFIRFALTDNTRISFGQFKRAFDLFQLTSSSQILVIERAGNVRGVAPCAGVGGVCSYSRFAERLEFTSLDVGALIEGELADGSVRYLLTGTNGSGGNARDENDAKSGSVRIEWSPSESIRLGGNVAAHDFPNPVLGVDQHAQAWGADVEWGDFGGGLHLQAGVMGGENWRSLDAAGDAPDFLTWQTIASYRIPLSGQRIRAVEPVARASWGDPDRGMIAAGGHLLTPGVMVHFEGRNRMAFNVDIWRPRSGVSHWSLKIQSYVHF